MPYIAPEVVHFSGNTYTYTTRRHDSLKTVSYTHLREYRKYQEKTIAPVEQAYIETIKDANKNAKQGVRRKSVSYTHL